MRGHGMVEYFDVKSADLGKSGCISAKHVSRNGTHPWTMTIVCLRFLPKQKKGGVEVALWRETWIDWSMAVTKP